MWAFTFKKVSGRQTEDTQGELTARVAVDALELGTEYEKNNYFIPHLTCSERVQNRAVLQTSGVP